ncbi:MAG TPA: U32 family peptidase [Desulfobulbaceae bacterium]|nr:U32 family peptidase [Desulfobulbaceae bacterium]
MDVHIPELLAPAGTFDKLVTAIHYGADAVYLGGERYSLRARAGNFDESGIKQAVQYAHKHGVKVYVTVNIFAHNRDLDGLDDYLRFLDSADVDALIIADPGIFHIARQVVAELPIHLSTQANVTNFAAAEFWKKQGAKRLNLARELGLAEIRAIRRQTDIELEIFVHGALCISYSGRCMLSNYFTGRDANQGDCAHPCRYSYKVVEEKRPGQYFPVEEDKRGTYIFNSRDLCLLMRLPELISAGADSIKIEGRMKSVGYVGSVIRVYRAALDWIKMQVFSGTGCENLVLPVSFSNEIKKIGTRGRTENFFDAHPSNEGMLYDTIRSRQGYAPAGIVRGVSPLLIAVRNPIECGDRLEYLGRDIEPLSCTVVAMETEDHCSTLRANPGTRIILQTDPKLDEVTIYSLFRKNMENL